MIHPPDASRSSPGDELIHSAANPRFRELVRLVRSARERRKRGVTVIEGEHLLQSFRMMHGPPKVVFVVVDGHARPRSSLTPPPDGAPTYRLATALFREVSQVENGRGPIAIVPTPQPTLPVSIDSDAVFLDGIQDPGNVGTILRTCAAAGVRRVITSADTAFCWSPKVLRAGMGAHFALEIHEGVDIDALRSRTRATVWGTSADARIDLFDTDLRDPSMWLFGSEGGGLSAAARSWPSVRLVRIPMASGVESLNVGAATAVCLFEQSRQRRR